MFFFEKPSLKRFDGYPMLNDIDLDSIPPDYVNQLYFQIYKKMAEMLDIVLSDYSVGEYNFIPVDDYLEDMFTRFSRIMRYFDLNPKKDKLPITTLWGYSLNGNFVENINSWSKLKDDILNDVIYLSKIMPIRYSTPPDLELAFNRIDVRLYYHKVKKDKLLRNNKKKKSTDLLNFVADKSITKTVFNLLLAANGEWVKVKDISKKIDKNMSYTRIVINNLQDKIKAEKKENIMKIEPSRKSSYKLIIS